MANKELPINDFIKVLQGIIEKNLGNPDFSVVRICTEMNLSRAQLHRKVKAATGLSTSLYIRRVRMEYAKKLLETPHQNVSEIAYQVGISSPQNFSKYFIEAYGISPSAFRKQKNVTTEETPVVVAPVTAETMRRPFWLKWQIWLLGVLLLLVCLWMWVLIAQQKEPDILADVAIPTVSNEAYRQVLLGKKLLENRTQESLQKSIQAFDRALELDSTYSDAYLGKANGLNLMVNLRYSTDETRDLREAERLSLFAIKHNTENAQAYAILGSIYEGQYRWQEALTTYQIALKLDPRDALINYWYSLILRRMGDLEQSLHYHQIAYEFDSNYSVITAGYIYTAIFARQFDLADSLLQQAKPDLKQSFLYPYVVGMLFLAQEQYESALPYFDTCQVMNPKYYPAKVSRIFCLGKMGKRQEVETFLAALDTTQAEDCLAAAVAYAGLGKIDPGMAYLQAAADKGKIPEYLLTDVRYVPFRQHPAFRSILEAYGLEPVLDE